MKKDENLKEKFKQALISTVKAISDDFNNNKPNKDLISLIDNTANNFKLPEYYKPQTMNTSVYVNGTGVNKNKKALKDAREADVVQNINNSSSSSNNNIRKRLLNNTKNDNKFGTINSLHQNDDKESDTNKYDGGSGTMYEGRDD